MSIVWWHKMQQYKQYVYNKYTNSNPKTTNTLVVLEKKWYKYLLYESNNK